MLVRLDNVSHNFSSQDLFFDVDLTVYEGDRIALIGQNGSGKTTLFNIISGEVEPIEGNVIRNNSLNIRFLKQFRADNASENLVQFLRASIVEEIDDIVINKSIRSILIGLGFEETQWERQVSTLSGGELTRLALGRTLVGLNNNMDNFMLEKKIPLLLLDEPTNHLDLYSIKWLISYLRSLRVTMITISHDRNFIKELSNKFWEINNYKVWDFSGDYETYMNQRENLLLSIQARKKNLEREMERLERMIDRYRKWATEKMVRQAIIRERSLEKLKKEYQEIESMQELKSIKIKIPEPEKTGYVVLRVEKLSFAYEENSILESISFEVGEGQKISVIGKNGCGKTTLLNILLGKLEQSSGTYQWGHNIKIGYLDQVISSFNQKLDLISEIWKLVP
ncbi:MAG TPA: ATP-binding cassette domain-containing protein, partial [Petrotogaceae bacterium]|nr:ATP-binding cassette domain-containing protein [Petrotogaceae bacterium]